MNVMKMFLEKATCGNRNSYIDLGLNHQQPFFDCILTGSICKSQRQHMYNKNLLYKAKLHWQLLRTREMSEIFPKGNDQQDDIHHSVTHSIIYMHRTAKERPCQASGDTNCSQT